MNLAGSPPSLAHSRPVFSRTSAQAAAVGPAAARTVSSVAVPELPARTGRPVCEKRRYVARLPGCYRASATSITQG